MKFAGVVEWFSEVYVGNPGPGQVVMAKRGKRGKRKTKNSNRSQPPASTASKRLTWALALTAVACVGIAGFFWLESLSGPQEELQRDEPPSQYTEENLEQETMAVLNRLVKDFPDSADPLGLMGDVYVELGKTVEAMKCWQKCTELQPHRPSSYERMAHTAVERGEFERAVNIAHKALKIDPAMPGIHSQLGRALRGLAKPTESVAALEKAVKISPKSAVNHHLLGQAYQQLQQYEQAKQSYMTALQINPNYTEACYGIVSVSARLGQKDEAARYRKKFQEMKARDWQTLPDERDYVLHQRFLVKSRHRASKTHTNAGIMYYERGQRQTAEKHWLRATELDPANTGCREELMTLYQQNGRNVEALGVCEQLRQIAPGNPQYHMCAGTLLTRMNRIEDALVAVKQAIELEPNNATFQQIYDQIQKRR